MPNTYTLDSEDEELARKLLETGRYGSIAEVLRDGLRRLAEDELLRDLDGLDLKALADEGEASGLAEKDADAALAELEERYKGLAEARRTA